MQTADVAKLEAERAAEEPVGFCCLSLSVSTQSVPSSVLEHICTGPCFNDVDRYVNMQTAC